METTLQSFVAFSSAEIEADSEHSPAQQQHEQSRVQFHRTGEWKKWNNEIGRIDEETCSDQDNARNEPNAPISSAGCHK